MPLPLTNPRGLSFKLPVLARNSLFACARYPYMTLDEMWWVSCFRASLCAHERIVRYLDRKISCGCIFRKKSPCVSLFTRTTRSAF